jgi:hypothetical protein
MILAYSHNVGFSHIKTWTAAAALPWAATHESGIVAQLSTNQRTAAMAKTPSIPSDASQPNEVFIYTAPDGATKVQLRFVGDDVLMTQAQMAELFGTSADNVGLHLKNIYAEGELEQETTTEDFSVVRSEGGRSVQRRILHYNLDAIISVGYRVSSKQATKFRQWATRILKEFTVKGHVIDVERLKDPAASDYFAELLEKIRDIRSSEANVWKRLLDLASLCSDYGQFDAKARGLIFATFQNMMHWGVTNHTAQELVVDRVNADQPHCGVAHFKGDEPTVTEALVAKNLYGEHDLKELNLLTNRVLDFFEDQTNRRLVVKLADFPRKLADFLKFDQRAVLTHAGSVSVTAAKKHVQTEMGKYKAALRATKEAEGAAAIEAMRGAAKSIGTAKKPPRKPKAK